jgi:hypothetical protein
MSKKLRSSNRLSVGQYLGLIMIVVSVPILLVGLVTWTPVAIFAGVAVALFGFIYRAYGIAADGVHGDAGPNAKYDTRRMAKIGRACYILFALACAAYILIRLLNS